MMHEWTYGYLLARRGLLLASVLLVSCCALVAQQDAPPAGPPPGGQMQGRGGMNPERQLQMLSERLSLTSDQQAQVKTILAEQREKMEALRQSNSGAPPDRAQMKAIRDESDGKISALLNDDQKTKFAEWQKERDARMAQRGGAPPPPPPQ
jgi:periplasmic protein CpxP/Spy